MSLHVPWELCFAAMRSSASTVRLNLPGNNNNTSNSLWCPEIRSFLGSAKISDFRHTMASLVLPTTRLVPWASPSSGMATVQSFGFEFGSL